MSDASHKGQSFNWDDPFLIDDQLTEDERMIRDAAQAVGITNASSESALAAGLVMGVMISAPTRFQVDPLSLVLYIAPLLSGQPIIQLR